MAQRGSDRCDRRLKDGEPRQSGVKWVVCGCDERGFGSSMFFAIIPVVMFYLAAVRAVLVIVMRCRPGVFLISLMPVDLTVFIAASVSDHGARN